MVRLPPQNILPVLLLRGMRRAPAVLGRRALASGLAVTFVVTMPVDIDASNSSDDKSNETNSKDDQQSTDDDDVDDADQVKSDSVTDVKYSRL